MSDSFIDQAEKILSDVIDDCASWEAGRCAYKAEYESVDREREERHAALKALVALARVTPAEALAALEALDARDASARKSAANERHLTNLLDWRTREKEAAEADRDHWKARAEQEEDQKRTATKAYLDMQDDRDKVLRVEESLKAMLASAANDRDKWRERWERTDDERQRQARRVPELEAALREIESLPNQSEDWHEGDAAVRIAARALAGDGVESPAVSSLAPVARLPPPPPVDIDPQTEFTS